MQSRQDICPRCSKAVYAAEMVLGPERKSYHKLCLSCTSCRSRLAPGSFQEHDGEPYCRNCHRRLFAPRDLRSANLPSTDKATLVDDPVVGVLSSSPRAARVTTRAPEGEADLTPREPDNNNPVAGRRATITAKEDEDSEEGKEAINPSNVDTTGVLSRSAGPSTNVISPMITGSPLSSPSGPRRSFGGVRVECPRCKKAVYQAEQVLAVGKKWHRACLQCIECGKRLDTHNLSDKDGEPYCRSCYAKNHGPAGAGYALLGKAGG